MTYILSVVTHRSLDLAATLPSELANVVRLCLRGTGIMSRRNWLRYGFRRVSRVSFFHLRRAPAETLQCIWQTALLVASSFAIVPRVLAALLRPRAGKRDG